MGDNSIQCPKCGHENNTSAIECDKCGVTLSLVLKKSAKSSSSKPVNSEQAPAESASDLSVCPKCGHEVLPSSEECIKCGIIFSKYLLWGHPDSRCQIKLGGNIFYWTAINNSQHISLIPILCFGHRANSHKVANHLSGTSWFDRSPCRLWRHSNKTATVHSQSGDNSKRTSSG